MRDHRVQDSEAFGSSSEASAGTPGRATLASQLGSDAQAPMGRLQLKSAGAPAAPSGQSFIDALSGAPAAAESPTDIATRGFAGSGSEVPYRSDMEAQFGTSFGDVRAHQGGAASEAAQDLQAQAYTLGSDVAFADANPSRELVAHELAHVVQGRGGVSTKSALSEPGDAHEVEADQVAARVAGGESVHDHVARYEGGVTHQGHWGRSGGAPQRKAAWGNPSAAASRTLFRKGTPAAPPAAGPAADEEAKKAEEARKELAEFKKKTYKQANHVPSTGYGAFDVEYQPMGNALNITVRCDFNFKDTPTAQWGGSGISGMVERVINQVEWVQEYMQVIKARWSNQYVMQCSKKYWEELRANTNVRVVYDSNNPHFRLTVHKTNPKQYTPGAAINVPPGYATQAPGTNPAWGGTLTGDLRSNVTQLKEDWRSETVGKTDAERMRKHIPSPIEFEQNSDAVKGPDTAPLKKLGSMLSMTRNPQLTVNIVGRASTEGEEAHNLALGQRRADNVAGVIRSGGGTIVHTLATSSKGEEGAGPEPKWRRVDVDIPDLASPPFRNDYDVGGHEFGHMVGLDEEYQGGAKSEHYQLVEEAFGTEVANTFVSREASSGSIMSSGLDVRPFHYVTFWEALGRVTSPPLSRADWKILT